MGHLHHPLLLTLLTARVLPLTHNRNTSNEVALAWTLESGRPAWVHILALLFPSCVTLGKLFNLKKKVPKSGSKAWVLGLLLPQSPGDLGAGKFTWASVYPGYPVILGPSSSLSPGSQRPGLTPPDSSAFSWLKVECGINLRKASACLYVSCVYII